MSEQLKPNMYVEVESWGWRGYPPEQEWSLTIVGSRELCQKVAAYVESLQPQDDAGRMARLFRACEDQLHREKQSENHNP